MAGRKPWRGTVWAPDPPVMSGLAAWWTFGDTLFTADQSGNQNNGIDVGGAYPSQGTSPFPAPINGALVLPTGGGTFLKTDSIGRLDTLTSFTYTAWVYWTNSGSYAPILSQWTNGPTWRIENNGVPGFLKSYVVGTTATTAITASTWTHLAVTNDGTTVNFYLNGVLDRSVSFSQTYDTGFAVLIGNEHNVLAFEGQLSDIRVYNRVLQAHEIHSIYEYGKVSADRDFTIAEMPITAGVTNYTMAGDAAAFTLAGQTAGLKRGLKLPSAAGSFTLAGQTAGLQYGRKVTAAVGAFTLSGKAAGLAKGYKLTSAVGAFTLSGQTATLRRTYLSLAAGAGAFTYSGQAAILAKGYKAAASAGSFTLSGQAAGLKKGYSLTAAAGAFSLSGQAASLTWQHVLTAGLGTFTLGGQGVNLQHGYLPLGAGAGSFALSGQAAVLRRGYRLAAGTGEFTLAGSASGLEFGRELTAAPGSFSLSGKDAGLAVGRRLIAEVGGFTLSGKDATLIYSGATKVLLADAGAFTLGGQAATLRRSYVPLAAAPAIFTLAGQTATLRKDYRLNAETGNFVLSGSASGLGAGRELTAAAGAFLFSGKAAGLAVGRVLHAGTGDFVFTGYDLVEPSSTYTLVAGTGSFLFSGKAAGLIRGRRLVADARNFILQGYQAQFHRGYALLAGAGSFGLTGQPAGLSRNRRLKAGTGAFSLSGQEVGPGRFINTGYQPSRERWPRSPLAFIGDMLNEGFAGEFPQTLNRPGIRLVEVSGQPLGRTLHRMTDPWTRMLQVDCMGNTPAEADAGAQRVLDLLDGRSSFIMNGYRIQAIRCISNSIEYEEATRITTRSLMFRITYSKIDYLTMKAETGDFRLSGRDADLRRSGIHRTLVANRGEFAMQGQPAILRRPRRVLQAGTGHFQLTRYDADLTVG